MHIGDSSESDAYDLGDHYFIPQEDTSAEEADHPNRLEPQKGAISMAEKILEAI